MPTSNPAYAQAAIPGFNPLQRPWTIAAPMLIEAGAANTKHKVYDETAEPKLRALFIHNMSGAGLAIKYLLNDPAPDSGSPVSTQFHGVLCGGTTTDDGVGSQAYFDCQKLRLRNLVAFSTGTVRLLVTKYYE